MDKKEKLNYFSSSFKNFFKLKKKKRNFIIDRFKQNMIKSKKTRAFVFLLFMTITAILILMPQNTFQVQYYLKNLFIDMKEKLSTFKLKRFTSVDNYNKYLDYLFDRADWITSQKIKTNREIIEEIKKVNNFLQENRGVLMNLEHRLIFDCAQIIGKYIDYIEKSFFNEKEFLDELFTFFLLFDKNYKINLAIEKYIYNTELNDYIENSMITIVNIYKLLINFNSTESILKLNQTFLNIINKNTEAKLMANYFDKEFLINFSKNFIYNIKELEDIALQILFLMNESNPTIGFELMNINFFSNFIVNKYNIDNKSHIINLINQIVMNHKNVFNKNMLDSDTFLKEIERLRILKNHEKFDNDIRKVLGQLDNIFI